MKKIILISLFFVGICSAYSQTDSLLLKNYEQKIIENSKLKTDLQNEKQAFSRLKKAYAKDTISWKKQIGKLGEKIASLEKKVSSLNKNKLKKERDGLLEKADNLSNVILDLRKKVVAKEKQIAQEKIKGKKKEKEAKEKGKAEVYTKISNLYKNRSLDDLIKLSTKKSVIRDMQLVGNNQGIKSILNDLQIYYNVKELLSVKFDGTKLKNAQTKLDKIKRSSQLLNTLKENVKYYRDYNADLKATIRKLVDLDRRKTSGGNPMLQKKKFNEIMIILADYIYDYYDYANFPYLFDIVTEIIKIKKGNADGDIRYLLEKL